MSEPQKPPEKKPMTASKLIAYAATLALGGLVLYGWVDQLPSETKMLMGYLLAGISVGAILLGVNQLTKKERNAYRKAKKQDQRNLGRIDIAINLKKRNQAEIRRIIERLDQIKHNEGVVIMESRDEAPNLTRANNAKRIVKEAGEAAQLRMRLEELRIEVDATRSVGYGELFSREEWPAKKREDLDR